MPITFFIWKTAVWLRRKLATNRPCEASPESSLVRGSQGLGARSAQVLFQDGLGGRGSIPCAGYLLFLVVWLFFRRLTFCTRQGNDVHQRGVGGNVLAIAHGTVLGWSRTVLHGEQERGSVFLGGTLLRFLRRWHGRRLVYRNTSFQ